MYSGIGCDLQAIRSRMPRNSPGSVNSPGLGATGRYINAHGTWDIQKLDSLNQMMLRRSPGFRVSISLRNSVPSGNIASYSRCPW